MEVLDYTQLIQYKHKHLLNQQSTTIQNNYRLEEHFKFQLWTLNLKKKKKSNIGLENVAGLL